MAPGWLSSPGIIVAQEPAGERSTSSAVADELRARPAKDYEFNRAPLRDVLRFLAADAGISYVSVPDNAKMESREVTFTLHASPFEALQVIAKSNGIALFYEAGVWYLRPDDSAELVGRTYDLKFDTQEQITYEGNASQSPQVSGQSSVDSTSAVQNSGTPDLGLSLQGPSSVFKSSAKQLIDGIKALLGLPIDKQYPDRPAETAAGEPTGPKVIWSSNTNTLYVVATREQHKWIEGYLHAADQQQNLIALEVKFVETTKDPRKQLGLDWSGTLAEGYGATLSNLTAQINLNNVVNPGMALGVTFVPGTAVLSAQDVAVRLRAFINDRDTSTVSYPRVLTRNNREVVIRSVINQPVLASTSSVTPGVGGTTTSAVSYLPIGTIINVLPKRMPDGSITLNLCVTISSIIDEKRIQGNDYPVATTRVYNAVLGVTSGYTLAVGGLEQAFDARDRNGIPFLKDIPLIGNAFRSNDRAQQKKNLMVFITPTLLPPQSTTGISETPVSTVAVTPNDPSPPAFGVNGALVGGMDALDEAIRWLQRQRKYFRNLIVENRIERRDLLNIRSLIGTAEMILDQIDVYIVSRPKYGARLEEKRAAVVNLMAEYQGLMRDAKKNMIEF